MGSKEVYRNQHIFIGLPGVDLFVVKTEGIIALFLSLVFLFSYLATSVIPLVGTAEAQQDENKAGRNWIAVDYDRMATQFNPQTQINKDNVQLLELKWIFPFPEATPVGGYGFRRVNSATTPLVVDGIVYFGTEYQKVFAASAKTGKVVWTYIPDLNFTRDVARGVIVGDATGAGANGIAHLHAISYVEGKLFVPYPPCDIHVIDALTGKKVAQIRDMCVNIPGNEQMSYADQQKRGFNVACSGNYKGVQSYGPTILPKDRVLIVPAGATDESNRGARGFFAGYDMNNYNLLWRFFLTPPQGGDPEWVTKVADKGWIQGVKASTIPREFLLNDWGNARCVQGGPGWGQYAFDEETGIVYVGTAQPAPDQNATARPGPNVFSNSIIALKARTGELVWWHQTFTHDTIDWDCAWNTVFAKIDFGPPRGVKKAVFKGCKNGIMYMLDAATGEAIWTFNPPSIARSPTTPTFSQQSQPGYKQDWNSAPGTKLNCPADGHNMAAWDPKDGCIYKLRWTGEPSKDPRFFNPNSGNGAIESDVAYAYNTIYVGTYNSWTYSRPAPVDPWLRANSGSTGVPAPESRPTNSTIYALDASTGKVKWSFFVDTVGFRAGITVSGGVAYFSMADGNLYAVDAISGKLITQKVVGGGLIIPPVIAADADGNMKLFQLFGGSFGGVGQYVPGGVVAYGLPSKLPEPQIITKEVVKEVVKEVPKEVIKEVIKEVVKEVPKEVVRTETKTVTVETISPVSYAAIGVGVVLVVIAGVLFTRRKKI